jgi:hypothetical protein
LFSGRSQTEAIGIKARIESQRAALGKAQEPFGFESIQQIGRGDEQCKRDIAPWRDAGGSHISAVTMGAGLSTVDAPSTR